METNNWRPAQVVEPWVDVGNWRDQLQPVARQRIVNKIMETMETYRVQWGVQELEKIAVRFEEKIFSRATSQSDYLRQLSLKMLSMAPQSAIARANFLPANPANYSEIHADPGGEPVMNRDDWRNQLLPESRQRIINKIMEDLKMHIPFSGQEGPQELRKIAVGLEEKIFIAATSQSDYLRKISLKMLTAVAKCQNTIGSSLQSNPANSSESLIDPGPSAETTSTNHTLTRLQNRTIKCRSYR